MQDVRIVKGLKTQLANIQADCQVLRVSISASQKELSLKEKSARTILAEVKRHETNGAIKVSEHAIVRYFERVKGFDLEAVQAEILSEEVRRMVSTLGGSGTYPCEGFSVVMKDYTVTTIVD